MDQNDEYIANLEQEMLNSYEKLMNAISEKEMLETKLKEVTEQH